MKAKEISYYDLIYPLMTQTVPPHLNYYGSIEDYDYFSVYYHKYKVFKSNMSEQYKFTFQSWDKKNGVAMKLGILELVPANENHWNKKGNRSNRSDRDEQGREMGGFRS